MPLPTAISENPNLASAVHYHSIKTPTALAVASEGVELTYSELAGRARALASVLRASSAWPQQQGQLPRVAVLASRSIDACVAVLGASWAGATYVPISLKSPEERLVTILSGYQFSALITDAQGAKLLTSRVMSACPPIFILPDANKHVTADVAAGLEVHDLYNLPEISGEDAPVQVKSSDLAYIIFTSGTTGVPKGVMISCGAIRHLIEKLTAYFDLGASDRVLETYELSFDPSVLNMLATWHVGASLHILAASRVMNAVKFARDSMLTVWNSVPSLAGMMNQIKALAPGVLPNIRLTLFGGEQLPSSIIRAWQSAAPNSVIENMYGPTEVTVACLGHRIELSSANMSARDVIPIGKCYPGCEAEILREDGTFAGPDEAGELIIFGAQLAEGYLDAPDLTAAKFPIINGRRCYLTGDSAVRDATDTFHHLGRIDNQVKVLGHRVELEEVEAHLRMVTGLDMVATVAWPIVNGAAQGLVAFVASSSVDQKELIGSLKARLPAYMVPAKAVAVNPMPLSPNGKVDRKALLELLRQESLK